MDDMDDMDETDEMDDLDDMDDKDNMDALNGGGIESHDSTCNGNGENMGIQQKDQEERQCWVLMPFWQQR